MAIRTKLLNGNNITRDTDFSKFIQTVSEPGVIEGFTVTANSVAVGQARVPCERTNGETLYALIYNTAPVSISGNGEVYILVNQTYIDDGELANEDGTGIATIVVGTTPSKNALKLATITNGVVADNRNIIPKVGELKTYIQSLQTRMNTAEQEIDEIKADRAINHLEDTGVVGELYTLTDTLFKQQTPTLADSTTNVNIGNIDLFKQVHIQRIASGVASNKLKIKAKKVGAPTTGLVVEVRRGIEVDVNGEAYWYGNDLICSGSIGYNSFSTDFQEIEITMNGQFGGIKGELLDVVIYQTGNIVNSTNYYVIGADSTQYSEGFSCVAVNGGSMSNSRLMPYCVADGFLQTMLAKVKESGRINDILIAEDHTSTGAPSYDYWTECCTYTSTYSGYINIVYRATLTRGTSRVSASGYGKIQVNGTDVDTFYLSAGWESVWSKQVETTRTITVNEGDTIKLFVKREDVSSRPGITYNESYIYTTANSSISYDITFTPLEIKSIGQQTGPILFGLTPNGDFYLGKEVSTATTGSITPGNFVGYVQIGAYKIPYYT